MDIGILPLCSHRKCGEPASKARTFRQWVSIGAAPGQRGSSSEHVWLTDMTVVKGPPCSDCAMTRWRRMC